MQQLLRTGRAGTSDRRRWLVFTMLSGLLAWLAAGGIGRVGAQEPAEKVKAAATKEAPPAKDEGAPPAEAAAAPAANANSAAPSGSAGGTAPPAPESLLSLAIRSSGPI